MSDVIRTSNSIDVLLGMLQSGSKDLVADATMRRAAVIIDGLRRELKEVARIGGVAYRELATAHETPAFTVEELMHEIHAAHAHTMWRNMPDGRSVPNLCQCRFCKSMGPHAQKANVCLCSGHSSEASISGWGPNPACPVHGSMSEPE